VYITITAFANKITYTVNQQIKSILQTAPIFVRYAEQCIIHLRYPLEHSFLLQLCPHITNMTDK